jgi:hypothetical protein
MHVVFGARSDGRQGGASEFPLETGPALSRRDLGPLPRTPCAPVWITCSSLEQKMNKEQFLMELAAGA